MSADVNAAAPAQHSPGHSVNGPNVIFDLGIKGDNLEAQYLNHGGHFDIILISQTVTFFTNLPKHITLLSSVHSYQF